MARYLGGGGIWMKKRYDWTSGKGYKSMIYMHLIFSIKYRRNVVFNDVGDYLREIFAEVLKEFSSELIEFGVDGDHVHILIKIPPNLNLSELVKILKGRSSFLVQKRFSRELASRRLWGKFWSPSYCAMSCGGAPLDVIKSYVENQGKH
ncbi:MAG: IS200/IS605 family transposase [Oligoflexus sp.]|nr:IS200/IS605 family transposase [Oligoflexus sp.]